MAAELKKEFPGVEPAIIDAILEGAKDLDDARKALSQISEDPYVKQKDELRKMICGDALSDEVLGKILKDVDGNVEAAIGPTFAALEAQTKKDKEPVKKHNGLEQKIRNLQAAFARVPKDIVKKYIEECEGDVDEATDLLLKHIETEDKKEKERVETTRNALVSTFMTYFPSIPRSDVHRILKSVNWESGRATQKLLEFQREKLQNQFPSATPTIISMALLQTKNDLQKARAWILASQAKEKKTEIDDKAQEDILNASSAVLTATISSDAAKRAEHEIEYEQKRRHDALHELIRDINPGEQEQIEIKPIKEMDEAHLKESMAPAVDLQIKLQAPKVSIDVGNPIHVSWEKVDGAYKTDSYDWIGLYQKSAADTNYITYEWRGKNTDKGSLTFTAPHCYGEYEFRYITSCKQCVARVPIKLGPDVDMTISEPEEGKLAISWLLHSGNIYGSSWIGLYKKSERNDKSYLDYQYCSKAIANTLTFKKPTTAGHYEFRFFNSSSYIAAASSEVYIVPGDDSIDVRVPKPGMVLVKCSLRTVDPKAAKVWVGLYFTSEENDRRYRRYKLITDKEEEVAFVKGPRHGGTYEARVFTGSYDLVVKSEPFTIESTLP